MKHLNIIVNTLLEEDRKKENNYTLHRMESPSLNSPLLQTLKQRKIKMGKPTDTKHMFTPNLIKNDEGGNEK